MLVNDLHVVVKILHIVKIVLPRLFQAAILCCFQRITSFF